MPVAMALMRLCVRAGSFEPSLLSNMTSMYQNLMNWLNLRAKPFVYIYILSVVDLDETNISGCLHFSMQNIEMSCDLDRAYRWSNINAS